jgi:glutathione synthase/RimK-type ligase-like ATP-grasp enzyme
VNGELACGEEKLSSFKFVVFGTVGDHGPLYAAALACVQACGVPYFSYGKSDELNSKTLQTVHFKRDSVPHPKTVIQVAKPDVADSVIATLKLPLITKIIDGSQGKGILKHETKEALIKELNARKGQLLIMQEALTASCDYRIFFVYDEPIYVDKRSATKKGEFRHNISLGGSIEKVELAPEVMAIARAAQKSMGFDASGVDLLQDEPTGKWYVLEVNSAPQFSEPAKVLDKLVELIKGKL